MPESCRKTERRVCRAKIRANPACAVYHDDAQRLRWTLRQGCVTGK